MKFFIILFTTSTLLFGCVAGLNSDQSRKLVAVKAQKPELLSKEKDEGVGLALGFLPGGGSFYTRNYVIGAVDLLLYPLSILWDPFNGLNGAKEINYYGTISNFKLAKKKEMSILDDKLSRKEISKEQYSLDAREIDKKYDIDNLL